MKHANMEDFVNLLESNWQHIPGSKSSNAPKNNNFAVFFIRLKLRRGYNDECMGVGESKAEIVLQSIKIMCSLEGS